MAEALIALGGNVGDVRRSFEQAISDLCRTTQSRLLARSADYATPPWGGVDQPPFVNACIAIETALAPRPLLSKLHEIEKRFGRDRSRETRWGPRALDLDLLAYDDIVVDEPDLTLPHPRMFERAFVLVPLVEIARNRIIAGRGVAEALARLATDDIERLPPLG